MLLIGPGESSPALVYPAFDVEAVKSILVGVVCGLFTSISGEYRDSIGLCSNVISFSSSLRFFPGLGSFLLVSELVGPVLKICMFWWETSLLVTFSFRTVYSLSSLGLLRLNRLEMPAPYKCF